MPRSAGFLTPVMELVFDQLEGASDATLRSTISASEELLREIDPNGSYPAEFVRWRLTDERVSDDPTSILGTRLRADLAVLIQRCSELVPIRAADHPEGITDLHEASASLGVSVRTIQRWRREGLVLRHVLFPDGQARLGLLASDLKDFRNASGDRLPRAAGFSRIGPQEQMDLLSRAQSLMSQGCSLNQAAREVAAGSQRAHETIRQLIRRHRGERGPITGMGGRVQERERTLVLHAIERGVDVPAISARIGRSSASTRRIAAEARAARLRGARPDWIELPAFAQNDAQHVLLGARDVVHRPGPHPVWSDPAELLDALRSSAVSPEALLLPAMNLQKCIAARLIDALPRTPPVGRLDEIEIRLLRADRLRRRVGESVLGASVSRVEQHLGASLDGLPSERMMGWLVFCVDVVGRTLDGFDPTSRGELEPRLDRRVALDTDKQIALLERDGRPHPEYMTETERPLQNPCERFESIEFLGLPDWLLGRVDRLEADQFELLEARYGLAREQPLFLSELCARFERSQRSITSDLARILRRLHQ